MKKSVKELKKEGEEIAGKLGNGVRYVGPQPDEHDEFMAYMFNDDLGGAGSFTAKNLEQAKRRLVKKRKEFELPPPNF